MDSAQSGRMYEMRWPDFVREPATCISAPAPMLTRRGISGDYSSHEGMGRAGPDGDRIGTDKVCTTGVRLTNRREFLQGAVWTALPAAVGAPLLPTAARAAVPRAFPMVLIDDRHAEARAFGAALAAWGAPVHAVPEGDVTALWRESIGPAWRQRSHRRCRADAISGIVLPRATRLGPGPAGGILRRAPGVGRPAGAAQSPSHDVGCRDGR